MPTKSFRLTYGKSLEQVLCRFDEDLPIYANLDAARDLLAARGLIPQNLGLRELQVVYDGRNLNTELKIAEQGIDIPDNALLTLQDRITSCALRILYKPDHLDWRTLTTMVDVNEPLNRQLADSWREIAAQYRFRGKHRKHYRLYLDKQRIRAGRPPASWGIDGDAALVLKPWAFPGWPLWLWEKLALAGVLIAVIAFFIDRCTPTPIPDRYWVTIRSSAPCYIKIADPDTTILLAPDTTQDSARLSLRPGDYLAEIAPKRMPIYSDTLMVPAASPGDSVWFIDPVARWKAQPRLATISVIAYRHQRLPGNVIDDPVMINGFVEEAAAIQGSTSHHAIILESPPRGLYQIEYKLKGMQLDEPKDAGGGTDFPREGVLRPALNRFDLSGFKGQNANFVFVYSRTPGTPSH